MSWDTGLANRIRAKGVRVVEVAGWKTRGSTSYEPDLALHHHTAGARNGTVPSLATCLYGRPGLTGPLCQVLQSRESDANDIAYVIAAGRANHAGVGEWRGISGNSRAGGVEVEHVGTTTVAAKRREITCRILAAILEGPGGSRDANNACQHFEYAKPAGRKIDFAKLAPDTPHSIRMRVRYWIGRTVEQDNEGDDDDMSPEEFDDRLAAALSGKVRGAKSRKEIAAIFEGQRDLIGDDLQQRLDSVLTMHAAVPESKLRELVQSELAEFEARLLEKLQS
jgi:hypothetical protein